MQPTDTLEDLAHEAKSAVIIGNGGGGDCLVGLLAAGWLRRMGVERVALGGIACQWWTAPGEDRPELVDVLGPDLYSIDDLDQVNRIHDYAAICNADTNSHGRRPHEAVLAQFIGQKNVGQENVGQETFIVSHQGGAKGAASGLQAVIEYFDADLVIAMDVGSDTLSTGREVRPTMTVLADHLTLAAVMSQDVPSVFCLAGFGADAELELEELTDNTGLVLSAGGLLGVFAPSKGEIGALEAVQTMAFDPVGGLVIEAYRGNFGLHHVPTASPWGQVARMTPAAVPIWAFSPRIVVDAVAQDVSKIIETTSLAEAERIYLELGRLPETTIVGRVDFRRP
jgi:hypothetical protein